MGMGESFIIMSSSMSLSIEGEPKPEMGPLHGRGEMSIISLGRRGDDETGKGGVLGW